MNERCVVFGSNSFSGSHLVKFLLGRGHDVLGISRSSEAEKAFRSYSWDSTDGDFCFLQADMNDKRQYAEVLRDFNPHLVFNFAAQSMVAQSWKTPGDWYRTNVLGLVTLMESLKGLPSVKKYVHVTTPEVYGSTSGWIRESWNFNPSTPYAVSRAAGDMHLRILHEVEGFPIVFTRAANVYGPGQRVYRVVPRALLCARLSRQMHLDGGGRSKRAFIHVDDVVRATYVIAQRGRSGHAYHVSTDEVTTIRDLVCYAYDLAGADFSELVVEGPARPGNDDAYMLDSSLLREELGWAPRISLEAGLIETLSWVDTNLTALSIAPDAYHHKE